MSTRRLEGSPTEIVELSTILVATMEDVPGVKVIASIMTEEKKKEQGTIKKKHMEKKILVIHPKDETTDCLSVIYEGRGWDVIRNPDTPRSVVEREIKNHDKIIMLGHGTDAGLLAGTNRGRSFYRFDHYIVGAGLVHLLKDKETFSIWCHSDAFFRKYGMKGLHTGMIISEVGEEFYILGHCPLNDREMEMNMKIFCGTFADHIDLEPERMKEKVLEEYVGDDEVTQYNRERIIVL